MPETPIAFDGVEMLTTSGLGHTFRIGDKEVFVGTGVPLTGTAAFIVGQVGRLVLPRWFVEKNGINGGVPFAPRRLTRVVPRNFQTTGTTVCGAMEDALPPHDAHVMLAATGFVYHAGVELWIRRRPKNSHEHRRAVPCA
jgi:hypothetical protein